MVQNLGKTSLPDLSQFHHEAPTLQKPLLLDNISEYIGGTPLVRLNRVPQLFGVSCQIYAKCEFLNPGGSVKDRIAKRMVDEAALSGKIEPGFSLIEPTSGNTGIGLAMMAAIKRYKAVITMPEKMSNEKVNIMKALGAEVLRTPTEAAFDDYNSHISLAKRLHAEDPKSIILDQYSNPYNTLAHYDGTAEEILAATNNGQKLDMLVAGAGTGGTASGLALKIREKASHVKIVGVDPYGSMLSGCNYQSDVEKPSPIEKSGIYQVEGIGYDFLPEVFTPQIVDYWYKCHDKESFNMARLLIKEEGLLCGGSSGAAMAAALHYGKSLPETATIVVILPDSVRNYMSKFLSDDWMICNQYMTDPYIKSLENMADKKSLLLKDLKTERPLILDWTTDLRTCFLQMKLKKAFSVALVDTKSSHRLKGALTLRVLSSKLQKDGAKLNGPSSSLMVDVETAIQEGLVALENNRLYDIEESLERNACVIICDNEMKVIGHITQHDVIYLTQF